jgi:hypothetical protein
VAFNSSSGIASSWFTMALGTSAALTALPSIVAEKTEASHLPEVHLAEHLVAQIASVHRDVFGSARARLGAAERLGSVGFSCTSVATRFEPGSDVRPCNRYSILDSIRKCPF